MRPARTWFRCLGKRRRSALREEGDPLLQTDARDSVVADPPAGRIDEEHAYPRDTIPDDVVDTQHHRTAEPKPDHFGGIFTLDDDPKRKPDREHDKQLKAVLDRLRYNGIDSM
ncbi:hypothetical protein LTR53_018984, partial [Teratosphaeriaceae sp. CCFEE 6253]